jgi:hypothetical protein
VGESIKHRRGSDHDRQHTDPDPKCYTDGNSYCNSDRDRNTDCYGYAYSKTYPIAEASCYTAASADAAAKILDRYVNSERRVMMDE